MKTSRLTLLAAGFAGTLLASGTATAGPAPASPITFAKAESIALARVPGGTVEDMEREHEKGRLVYEVEVRAPDGREHDITIDAKDGKIIDEHVDKD